MEKFQKTHE